MSKKAINLQNKFQLFSEQWSPKVVAKMNDYQLKLAKIEGDFIWHSHPDTDEVFLVVEGEMRLDFRDESIPLKQGEMYVVPKGVEHKPFAEKECKIMLVELAGTVNTGESGGEKTANNDVWI